MHSVHFLARYEILIPEFWWALQCDDDVLSHSSGEWRVKLELQPDPGCEESPRLITEHRTGLTMARSREVSTEAFNLLSRIDELNTTNEAPTHGMTKAIEVDGLPRLFSYEWTTTSFWKEMFATHEAFDKAAFELLNRLFWRIGVHCGPSTLESVLYEFQFSLDGENFNELPTTFNFESEAYVPDPPNDALLKEGFRFASTTSGNGFQHVLFREAWNRRASEPRVAIIMATAALESAVKHLISELVPNTGWLVENVPSPPMPSMLANYIPSLPVKCDFKGKALPPPQRIRKIVEKMVQSRNKLAHGRQCDIPERRAFEGWMTAIRDVIWLMDYYAGHAWAIDHLTETTRTELESGNSS